MSKQPIETWIFESFDGSRTSVEADHRRLAPGSLNQIITGNGKAQAFKGFTVKPALQGSMYLTNAGEGYAGLGSFADTNVKGSAFRILSALFFVGNGALRFNGASLGAAAASILQLKLLAGGSYGGVTYQAGLSQPLAPTLATLGALGVGFTGKLKAGTYSAVVFKIRSETGVRSIKSLQSNTIVVTETGTVGKSARITLPAIGGNGANRWGIAVSPRNFGSTGPHYVLMEVNESALGTVDGVPRSVEIEWTDGDLVGKPLAPIDSFVPPAAMFGGVLGDSAFLDGCYGDVVGGVSAGAPGSTIVQSLPLRPEEFPPDWAIYPPEPPTALHRGGDGFFYRFGKSSMGVISNVGGEPPLAFQLMWPEQGIAYPHNAVVGTGGRIYAFGKGSLMRIGEDGEPETEWAAPIADQIADWDDEGTVLGWDTRSHTLVAANNQELITYNSQKQAWGTPIDESARLPGDIVAAVTQGNNLIIAARDDAASDIKLYDYNTSTGSLMRSQTDWHYSNSETDTLRQVDIVLRADSQNPVTVEVFANEDDTTPVLTETLAVRKTGVVQLPPIRTLLPNLQSFCVKVSQQTAGGDAGFEKVAAQGTSRQIAS
jgi:hypothetical protein